MRDFSKLTLKADHENRPLWVCPDGRIYLEAQSPLYGPAYDFLVAIAEPVARPEFVHEYRITPHSLYAAVSVAISPEKIVSVLDKLSKVKLPEAVEDFVKGCTKNFGRAKLVLRQNRHYIESHEAGALRELLSHATIRGSRDDVKEDGVASEDEFAEGEVQAEAAANRAYLELEAELDEEDEDAAAEDPKAPTKKAAEKAQKTLSFRLRQGAAQEVKRIAAKDLEFPLQEEYDFRHDSVNATLPIDLRPSTRIRNYQEKSLSKMFGNGRARSGIIVLPCGAGKTLTAIVAAATVKRWTLVLCSNATAVAQWKNQFLLWTTLDSRRISLFTADVKDDLHDDCGILITTYHMVSFGGTRAAAGERLIQQVKTREWGLMLLDEVHVVPAATFRKVLALCNAHCKLGLTATLVREDNLITDLNFLIGPKLYEANWMDLTHAGHLANVQCVEIWCPMSGPFYREYLRNGGAGQALAPDVDDASSAARRRRLLYVLNPVKFRACEYLVHLHEARGDKTIVFSDDVYALLSYAKALERPAVYGATKEAERQAILASFRFNSAVNTVCLSKVGDVAIDLPEANVIVQVSSHFGSRRQEAQRLGRILRAKPNSDGTDGFNAVFYTLVSRDTDEMFYSTKRQQYLVDQGYTFKVVTDLPDRGPDSVLNTPEKELDLLNDVLTSHSLKEEEAEEKAIKDAANGGIDVTRRATIAATKLSGGEGRAYYEYDAPVTDASSSKKRHRLFKSRAAKKARTK
ncbi:hypothetical protein CTAYLR_000761 [Chrysophaeum taylorii]|uniref:DNA 3'-5' helicase n=1 Tax=Chrysophaeum taylorii TaxID=2483200 RepID=A0AAD7UQW7_9STRA|nr:hypothetical protein CTAYLR_000761 [Chrysophaeum taylorii]